MAAAGLVIAASTHAYPQVAAEVFQHAIACNSACNTGRHREGFSLLLDTLQDAFASAQALSVHCSYCPQHTEPHRISRHTLAAASFCKVRFPAELPTPVFSLITPHHGKGILPRCNPFHRLRVPFCLSSKMLLRWSCRCLSWASMRSSPAIASRDASAPSAVNCGGLKEKASSSSYSYCEKFKP